jgi:hypothetical protein
LSEMKRLQQKPNKTRPKPPNSDTESRKKSRNFSARSPAVLTDNHTRLTRWRISLLKRTPAKIPHRGEGRVGRDRRLRRSNSRGYRSRA